MQQSSTQIDVASKKVLTHLRIPSACTRNDQQLFCPSISNKGPNAISKTISVRIANSTKYTRTFFSLLVPKFCHIHGLGSTFVDFVIPALQHRSRSDTPSDQFVANIIDLLETAVGVFERESETERESGRGERRWKQQQCSFW